jgi:adenylate cyclase
MWSKVKRFFWQSRGVWVATPAVAGLVILLRLTGTLQSWEWETYDLYTRLKPTEKIDRRILIVGIDEQDVRNLKESIVPDRTLAKLLEKIKTLQPRAIGLDLYRDLPVPPGYADMVKVFQTTPNLVGIEKVAGEIGRETVTPSPILKAKGQIGANDLIIDADNKVRRGLLYLNNDKETVYSFALHLAGHYLAAMSIIPQEIPDTHNWQIGKAVFVPFEANDGGYVGADAGGFQFLINYRSGKQPFAIVSMTDILENKVPKELVHNRVVLIGKVGESFKDLFFTPYSNVLGLSKAIPGVEIHAHLVSQIISAALDDRPLIKIWSDPIEWSWILLWSGIGASISWQFRYREGKKRHLLLRWGLFLLAGGTLLGTTYGAFLAGWWLPVIPPFLALAGSSVAITAYIARTAVAIRKTFGRYLTDQVVANLLENPTGLNLGGERRKITILTSDLRGFTSLSERISPEEVIKILNFYFSHMADRITKYQGTIDEFMGDGILVLFGAPTQYQDDALRAVACAVEMQLAMEEVNQQLQAWGFNSLEMGIGINTGEVVVGNIGSEKRTKYGVVGAQVNLTYRIESFTTGGQILISETTLEALGDKLLINGRKEVQPKGLKQPITIYDIGGVKAPYHLRLTVEEEIFVPLVPPIPIQCFILEGKQISNQALQGNLVGLSAKGAEIVLEYQNSHTIPASMTNLKLKVFPPERLALIEEDFYGKILDKQAKKEGFYVHFTARSPAIEAWLHSLYNPRQNPPQLISIEEKK